MAKIVFSAIGSFGDIHPPIALGLELKKRGHDVVLNVMEDYRDKIEKLGFKFKKLCPKFDFNDHTILHQLMDTKKGPEILIRKQLLPSLHEMFLDVSEAVKDADILITSDLVFSAKSVVEKTGIKWISTTLATGLFFSSYDPTIYSNAQWLKYFRFMPAGFHKAIFSLIIRKVSGNWLKPYRAFRRELGLHEKHDPITEGNHSNLLHLALFSKTFAKPQIDWYPSTVQTGFCFYDEQHEFPSMPEELINFFKINDPPVVFTLGSAAVETPGTFFEESIKTAKILKRRALILYGNNNEPPKHLDKNIVGFPYAPYALIFPRALCVVHQGGVGTTAQAIRAGIPQLMVPFSYDQPDNAARCKRMGIAEVIKRNKYKASNVVKKLQKIIRFPSYRKAAGENRRIINSEDGITTACNEIENILIKQ